jgi:hypothetical protein
MSLVNYSTREMTGKIATRKLVLRGADGVVFVADSQREQLDENLDSLRNLHENPLEEIIDVRSVNQLVLQNLSPRCGHEIGQP